MEHAWRWRPPVSAGVDRRPPPDDPSQTCLRSSASSVPSVLKLFSAYDTSFAQSRTSIFFSVAYCFAEFVIIGLMICMSAS